MAEALKVTVEKDALVIRIPLKKEPKRSESGKNDVIASTHGTVTTEAQYKGKAIKLGLNAFVGVDE